MGAKKRMKMEKLAKTASKIDSFLSSKLSGEPKDLYQAASYLIDHGGKRLRPYMVIKSCQLLGGTPKQAIPAAAAVEMVHNFTLVHDDIMDNDEVRHGVPTVHVRFGMPIGILAGDLLFSRAFETISKPYIHKSGNVGLNLVTTLAKACTDVCEGQALDISMAKSSKIPSEDQYIKMIEKKTSSLFVASCAMGAIAANKDFADVTRLSTFGRNLGIAFQIIDDLIGVTGDPKITKKPVGNDIREGKKSLPILMAIKKANSQEKKIILNAFGNPSVSKSEVERAISTISALGIGNAIKQKATYHSNAAMKSISIYDGPAKNELLSLLDFVVERSL
ncbi:MAG: polyprenyl synthetase family protein [Candidatus Nitrosotalea sp.]|nr:polyprenyl synthetase family protein [Candidatus Nitrosotalea sp.]